MNNCISRRQVGKGMLTEMTVAAKPNRVWHVLTSFDRMVAHMSHLEQSRTLRQKGNHRLVEQTAKIPLLSLTLHTVLDVLEERPFLYFTQREGPFSELSGYWQVAPTFGGTPTLIRYYLELRVGGAARRWMMNRHLGRVIDKNFQDLAIWIDSGND
jgi:carbon monoxide dehydrogenase subunit G